MIKTIPPEQITEIIDRCDIVEMISSYIPLKKAGRNFKAACPFHNEKTPSFLVSPDKQIFHCFGCGEGGNTLSFLMKYERLDFKEAIKILAEHAGITIHLHDSTDDKEKLFTTELYRIMEIACSFYQEFLIKAADQQLKKYLASRQLNHEALRNIRIGLAPNDWSRLLDMLRSKGINIKLIEKAGLIIAKESGGYYDRFRNRLIIPIHDVRNRIVAFGARALDDTDKGPKYINSPETPIYTKGKTLFGLHFAKDSIREKDYAVIVEGYFDVITPLQHEYTNIVASSGTALTPDQIRLLKRYSQNTVVVFDSDKAGQLATLRSLELFLEEEMNVRIVDLPKGYDPDLLVRKFGIDKFQELVDNSLSIFDYKLKILNTLHDKSKIEEKTKIALEMLSMIKKIKNAILRSEYIKLLAERISIHENILIKELQNSKDNPTANVWFPKKTETAHTQYPKAERMLLRLILDDIQVIESIENSLAPSDLQDKKLQEILLLFIERYKARIATKPHQIINYFEDEHSKKVICELTSDETLTYKQEQRDTILLDCIHRIKSNCFNLHCQDITTRLKQAQANGDTENLNHLKEEFNLLIQLKKRGHVHEKIRN